MRRLSVSAVFLVAVSVPLAACSAEVDDAESSASAVGGTSRPSRLFSPGMDGEVSIASDACSGDDDPGLKSHLACAADGKSLQFCAAGKAYTRVSCAEGCSAGRGGYFGAYCRSGASTRQRIVVSQKQQKLRAYENGVCVNEYPISTGASKKKWSEALGTREQLYSGTGESWAEEDGRLLVNGSPTREPWHVTSRLHDWFMGEPRTSETPWTVHIHPTTNSRIAFHSATWSRQGPLAPDTAREEASSSEAAASNPANNCGHCGKPPFADPQRDGSVRYYGSSHGCVNERVEDARWLALWINYTGDRLDDGAPEILITDRDFDDQSTPCAHASSPRAVEISASDPNQCYLASGAAVDYTAALGNPPSARERIGAPTPHAGLRGEGCYTCGADGKWRGGASGCPIVVSESDANQCYLAGAAAVDLNAARGNAPTAKATPGSPVPHPGLRGEGCFACGGSGRWEPSSGCP